jgi:alpha 1,2-mannosyltransferase
MRYRTRTVACGTILLITFTFYSWKAIGKPKTLPTGAETFSGQTQETKGTSIDSSSEFRDGQGIDVVQEFLQRPILSYDASVNLNSKTCPTEGVNFDEGVVKEQEEKWRRITPSKISRWRKDIAEHLYRKSNETQGEKRSDARYGEGTEPTRGRGIVMAAGDSSSVNRARTNIRFLRSYNCTLPVEIFHFRDEMSESDKSLLEELSLPAQNSEKKEEMQSRMKVTVREVEEVQKANFWKEFQIKGAAIQQSSFDEILYLDTDSYLLRNPEYLFESKQWQETGLMLWPDYTTSHPTNPIWRLIGQPCRNEYEGESGQILISRTLHQDLLWLVEYFAINHRTFYGFMGGDRDSFRAAALALGKKWTGPGRLNAAAGVVLKDNPQGGGHTMLQADPAGKWTFVHANLIKHAKFSRPLWSRIHRVENDKFAAGTTYGNIDPPNDRLGNGVKLRVTHEPMMSTVMSAFEGYGDEVVAVEDWDSYDELKGYEEKWFQFGGQH